MKTLFVATILLIFALNGNAGEYFLTISDDPNSACALKAKKYADDMSYPIRSTQEVVLDLERYFTGHMPTLELFRAIFVNARIKFCTDESRQRILVAIIDALVKPDIFNEWDAYDYLYMLGTPQILKVINDRLDKERSPLIRKRFARAKKSVERGLKERNAV
jgi:hypothetical protein